MVGKHWFRVRERHVADHLIPLIRQRALGAAKLDLVLRAIALPAAYAGTRDVGLVLPKHSWEVLHDLVRDSSTFGTTSAEIDASASEIRLKRKWVGEQLRRLEDRKLVRRIALPGGRPRLLVLRDDASEDRFDDPDGQAGNTYVSIRECPRICVGMSERERHAYYYAGSHGV